MIGALILAAGESRRMGTAKLLLPFGEKTIIETVIANVLGSQVKKLIVVLGANREKMEERLKNLPLEIVVNPDFASGMLSSVQCGLRAMQPGVKAALVFLADQPGIGSAVVDAVVAAYRRTGKGIVLPIYQSRRGHPVLIDMKYRYEVECLDPGIGLRELIRQHPQDTLEVEVDTPGILRDIDNPEDYGRELKLTGSPRRQRKR